MVGHGSRVRLMQQLAICILSLLVTAAVCGDPGKITFQEDTPENRPAESETSKGVSFGEDENVEPRRLRNSTRQGKDLFDWIGLGTGKNTDPYLAEANEACLNGDLAECFKSRALNSLSDFFGQPEYELNDNVRVVRMPRSIVKEVNEQPYEYSSQQRSGDTEWDKLLKFVTRKVERFVKTFKFEIDIPESLTGENDVYAPRFIDEIADEIDTLEDKKAPLFSRNKLRRLILPMLIVLKLFKLKLLLFLPLILGLASFKKFLGFLAIVVPGLIGFFHLCKPLMQHQPPVYTQSGIGYPIYKDHGYPTHNYEGPPSDTVSFGHDLAYQGYREYRS